MYLAKDDWAVLRDIFDRCDKNDNGKVDAEELKSYQEKQKKHNDGLLELVRSNPSSDLGGLTEDQFIKMIKDALD